MNPAALHLVESAALPYLLVVPATPPAQPRPVLCFLHGYGEAAPLDIHRALTRHGPLRPGSAPRATADFIVVAPQMPVAGDLWHRHADAVATIVRDVQATHHGDPRRTYLTGFSFGGNGVFDLALQQPERWAALWPVDPTRVPKRDPACPVWLSFGEISRRGRARFIERLQLRPVDAPSDAVPSGDRLCLDQGEDHVGSARLAYRDEQIYAWLLTQRLPDRDG